MNPKQLINEFESGKHDEKLISLYGADAAIVRNQRDRYVKAIGSFTRHFPYHEDVRLYSAPGRTEIGGNHTDHQHGCALAAAVNLDAAAVVSFHHDGVIRVCSEGYSTSVVELSDLSVHDNEAGESVALIRGIAAGFQKRGVRIDGFDAYVFSDVLSGSGLSSSAAFETLLGTIIDERYNKAETGAVEIAKIGRFAENAYFGKSSGLLDQLVSAVGGFVFIDFCDDESPAVKQLHFDFEKAGYRLCITDTKGSHSDLTDDYSAVAREMRSVAAAFGKTYLREVEEEAFFSSIPELHGKCSDRAILRAIHFFGENSRAIAEAGALERCDLDAFFTLYRRSSDSSANLLQNLYSTSAPAEQGIPLALAVSKRFLGDNAAVRVHGGGFAGTIQAFVPSDSAAEYAAQMDALFGKDSCHVLCVRAVGGVRII